MFVSFPASADDDDIEGLFGSLAIGEKTEDEIKLTKIDKALQEAETCMKTGEFDRAIELTEQVLAQEPAHALALRLKNQARRERFWKKHGDMFILAVILIVIVPSAWRILEHIKTGR